MFDFSDPDQHGAIRDAFRAHLLDSGLKRSTAHQYASVVIRIIRQCQDPYSLSQRTEAFHTASPSSQIIAETVWKRFEEWAMRPEVGGDRGSELQGILGDDSVEKKDSFPQLPQSVLHSLWRLQAMGRTVRIISRSKWGMIPFWEKKPPQDVLLPLGEWAFGKNPRAHYKEAAPIVPVRARSMVGFTEQELGRQLNIYQRDLLARNKQIRAEQDRQQAEAEKGGGL